MKRVVIHSEARTELDDAMTFYESRARGLGLDLQAKVEDAVAGIRQNSEAWPPYKNSGFRRRSAERFPTLFLGNPTIHRSNTPAGKTLAQGLSIPTWSTHSA